MARGLGRGLDALFADATIEENTKPVEEVKAEDNENSIIYIDINDIKPNANQPRKTFDQEKIKELAASILEHGLIQPIVVRKLNKGYEIVAGERRYRAAREAEIKKLPCIVRQLDDRENMLLAIIENMQREDLNPIEEAEGLNQMIKSYGLTQEEVSKSVGKSRPYISNSLRLLKLSDVAKKYLAEGKISAGHARALVAVEDEERQEELCKAIEKEGLSVRDIERMAKAKAKRRPAKKVKDPNVARIEEELKKALGTKVAINKNGKKGKIEIEFFSNEELERILDLLEKLK
ncbi:MAG: ParB/RepB/Spo0J family partition protein [Clostridia bacterium]|nr:ParB/RepB/Spo0J family partition protein [Clostridia bacterium]